MFRFYQTVYSLDCVDTSKPRFFAHALAPLPTLNFNGYMTDLTLEVFAHLRPWRCHCRHVKEMYWPLS